MKMKIMALLLLVMLPALAVTAVYATKPMVGHGTVTLVNSVIMESRKAGDNTIATVKNTFMVTGTLSGTAVALERDVIHASGGHTFTTFHGVANFTNTSGGPSVASTSGTLVIHYVGVNNGTFVHGQFVAGDGTGSFAGFHGQGDFSGKAGSALNYTLKWHIEPQPQTKTAH